MSRVSLCYPSAGRPGGLTYSGVMAWLCDGGHPDARTYAYEVQGAKAFEDMPRSNVPGRHLPPLATSPYPATHPYLATALTLLHLLTRRAQWHLTYAVDGCGQRRPDRSDGDPAEVRGLTLTLTPTLNSTLTLTLALILTQTLALAPTLTPTLPLTPNP